MLHLLFTCGAGIVGVVLLSMITSLAIMVKINSRFDERLIVPTLLLANLPLFVASLLGNYWAWGFFDQMMGMASIPNPDSVVVYQSTKEGCLLLGLILTVPTWFAAILLPFVRLKRV